MVLDPGTRLGPYEVTAPIGAGGMGEVYRATDTNLKRQVAIKVLPAAVAGDAERLARFQREAEVLAQLNHPHIAQIHGLERADGHIALVMELVEGPTLADRIAQGAVPVDEALAIARQIADALEAAHEQGIIHRDLKPANIKVRSDGTVKVLDFGLAKALEPAGVMSGAPISSMSPTITTPAMTQAGMILGTAAYMAPEQARGRAVDKRADIWAFGCVLYEMLTGQRAFGGEDVAETLGAIIHKEPDLAALPGDLPARVGHTVRLCLRKPLRERMPDLGAVRMALDGAFDVTPPPSPQVRSSSRRLWVVSAVAALGAGLGVGALVWILTRPAPAVRLHATLSHPAPEYVGGNNYDANIAVSPDGLMVAYVATTVPGNQNTLPLYVRRLDQAAPVLVAPQGRTPFFSPDGAWVGFVENNARLSKVPVGGGAIVPIGGVANAPRGASWGDDGWIVFATSDLTSGLWRISADGGEAERLTTPAEGELGHVFPFVLPGSDAVLFTISREGNTHDVAILDVGTRTHRVLNRGGSDARYSPSGHLVYGLKGSLLAVPFDLRTLNVSGTPVQVLEGVRISDTGAASFGLGGDGTLMYVAGGTQETGIAASFAWLDPMGRETAVDLEPRDYRCVAVSPQGDRIATCFGAPLDLWVSTASPVTMTRLTFDGNTGSIPVWSPDGRRLLFNQGRNVRSIAADGSGPAVTLLEAAAPDSLSPTSVDRQGRLLYDERRILPSGIASDVKAVALDGSAQPTPVLTNPGFNERNARVSPDGRWLAFISDESGREEVYVRTYPDVGAGKWQISREGGGNPRWAPDSRGVYFTTPAGLMKATLGGGAVPEIGAPALVPNATAWVQYDVSPDGRVLLLRPATDATPSPEGPLARRELAERLTSSRAQLNIVLYWTESLTRLAPSP